MRQYGISPTYETVRRVRDSIRKGNVETHNDAFRQIPDYIARLDRHDPEGTFFYRTSGNHITLSFIAPSATKAAFKHLPALFSVDGCHSRSIHDYILLMATAHDANSHIVVLAWGHCKSESHESWTWFIRHLKEAYPTLDRPGMTLISDRQKGLATAVHSFLPAVNHGHCTVHLKENVRAKWPLGVLDHWNGLVYGKTEDAFKRSLDRICAINPEAYEYIKKIAPSQWARYAFETARFGYVSSNVAEATNAILKQARTETVIELFDYLWTWQAKQFVIRHTQALSIKSPVVPKAKQLLDQQKLESKHYCAIVTQRTATEIKARVDPTLRANPGDFQRIVHLTLDPDTAWCSCLDFKEYLLACRHIIAVCDAVKLDGTRLESRRFNDPCWSIDSYVSTYEARFPIILTAALATQTDLHPPQIRAGAGRRQEKRYKKGHRPTQASQMRSEAGGPKRKIRCGNCQRFESHNTRTCPWPRRDDGGDNDGLY